MAGPHQTQEYLLRRPAAGLRDVTRAPQLGPSERHAADLSAIRGAAGTRRHRQTPPRPTPIIIPSPSHMSSPSPAVKPVSDSVLAFSSSARDVAKGRAEGAPAPPLGFSGGPPDEIRAPVGRRPTLDKITSEANEVHGNPKKKSRQDNQSHQTSLTARDLLTFWGLL